MILNYTVRIINGILKSNIKTIYKHYQFSGILFIHT